jgi:glycosyltransferase involved in cell wall biosynthesis
VRILIATGGIDEAGGVQTYLAALTAGLAVRGHALACLHHDARPADAGAGPRITSQGFFGVAERGFESALRAAADWRPDVCFSHNMASLAVERMLVATWPTVKMMHGYIGTCIGGQKMFSLPSRRPCGRRFGRACLGLYLPRRCGQLRPLRMMADYRWAVEQQAIFPNYQAIIVASRHMRDEYTRNGADPARVHVLPLFSDETPGWGRARIPAGPPIVLFLGRMTPLKGGDVLIGAIARASAALGRDVTLVMAGDGPQRGRWQRLAGRLHVRASFPGWLAGRAREQAFASATVLALPSIWPEPFGLGGLEAGARGVPTVAFDVGGVSEWLRDGESGILAAVSPDPVTSLAQALESALADPARLEALGRGALAQSRAFSVDRHLAAVEMLLARAAGGPAAATAGRAP